MAMHLNRNGDAYQAMQAIAEDMNAKFSDVYWACLIGYKSNGERIELCPRERIEGRRQYSLPVTITGSYERASIGVFFDPDAAEPHFEHDVGRALALVCGWNDVVVQEGWPGKVTIDG